MDNVLINADHGAGGPKEPPGMDQQSYHQRAGIAPDPPLDQRVKALERMYADLVNGLRVWVRQHNKEQKRWRETHAADTDAMQDHIYAIDQKVRNLE